MNLNAIERLHESIRNGDLEKVKEFAINNVEERLCKDSNDVCALELAIDCRQFKIYSYLRANGFYTENGTVLDEKIERLSETQKEEIRIENLKYVKKYPNAFIGVLLSKCKFDACSSISSTAVRKMLIDLSRLPELRTLLQVVSEADIKIIFDFSNESVKSMVPKYDESTMGLAFFNQGELYVGRDRDKPSRYGTFIHELTHMALYLVYENSCLPYCEGDVERETEWDRIVQAEMRNANSDGESVEPIIQWVFEYYNPGYQHLAELAVRPNHIMAHYFDNSQRVQELRETHAQLFNYLQNFVNRDLSIPNLLRLINLNNNFSLIQRIENSGLQLNISENFEVVNRTHKKLAVSSRIPSLALSKIYQEIKNSSQSKLDVKVKNIFVDIQKINLISLKNELKNLLKTKRIDRVIIDASDAENVKKVLNFVEELQYNAQVVVVCNSSDAEKFSKASYFVHEIELSFESLTLNSRRKLLQKEVNFQGNGFKISNFLNEVSYEILPNLISNDKISINCNENVTKLENFIPRIVERKTIELILDKFAMKSDRVVVLSDIAGNGKTSLIKKVYEKLLEEYPKFWISFVNLRDFMHQLSESDGKNFQNAIIKILKLNGLEQEILSQKFSKGEVKILFDGFDEISPRCKDETLKLFKLFLNQNENQIFITTRTHLEQDLEKELKVESFKIKPLTDKDQIQFLCNFWKNSHQDQYFVKICAKLLTQKISEIVKDYPKLIGIPMIIQSVAKLFVNKINENFKNEIKNLKLSEIYQKIFEECLNLLNKDQPTNVTKRLSPMQVHEYFAVVYFFGEDFAKELGLTYDEKEYPLEEVARYGIINYDKKGKIYFNHQTYAEHLLSIFMTSIFKNHRKLSEGHLELFHDVLSDDKFEISRIFLDENLENFNVEQTWEIFRFKEDLDLFHLSRERKLTNLFQIFLKSNLQNFCDIAKVVKESLLAVNEKFDPETFMKFFKTVQTFFGENIFDDFLFKNEGFKLMSMFSSQSIFETFAKTLRSENRKLLFQIKNQNGTIFALSNHRDAKKFKIFIDFIFNSYQNEIFEILNEKTESDNKVEAFAESKEIFECLIEFLRTLKGEKDKFKNDLKVEGFSSNVQNILMKLIKNSNEIFFYFIFENIFEKFFDFKDFIYKCDDDGENFLHFLARFGSVSMIEFVFKKLQKKLSEEELKDYLKAKDKYRRNLLMLSIQNSNLDSFKFLWKVFEKNLSRQEIFELLTEKDERGVNFLHYAAKFAESKEISECLMEFLRTLEGEKEKLKSYLKTHGTKVKNILMKSIENSSENFFSFIFENIFEKFFDFIFENIFEKFFDSKDFIYECDDEGENFLHFLARFGSVSMLEFAFKKLEDKLSKEELKNYLKVKGFRGRNLLMLLTQNSNLDSIKFLWKVLEENLSRDEIFEFLNEKDEDGNNFLHHAAMNVKSKEIFEFLWMKIFEIFKDEKEKLKNYLKVKDFWGRNLLMRLTENSNLNSIKFLWKVLEKNLSRDEIFEFLNEKDEDGNNFIHLAADFAKSKENFEFLCANIEKALGTEVFKEMLKQKNKYGYTPLHNALGWCSADTFKKFTKIYEENFTNREIKEILETQDFMWLANSNRKDKNMKEHADEFYKKLCDGET